MSFAILCIVVLIFYAVIWFFDSFFKSCMHYPYFAFLEGTGLKIGIFNFSWTTSAFNRFIYRWGKNFSRVLQKWFTCGYLITLITFLPFAVWTLVSLIIDNFVNTVEISSAPQVTAMLPGVNIPLSDFWIYFFSLGISTIFHELGHALAAVQEDVQVLSVGLYVFSIMPIAFVKLNTEHLNSLPITKRLKIYCAGVWHNIIIAGIAFLLFLATPTLFSFAYRSNIGLRVVELTADSPLKDVRGLDEGDVIISLNGCEVKNTKDWENCIHLSYERYGICTSSDFIAEKDEINKETIKENGVVECCSRENIYSICLEYTEPKTRGDTVLAGQYFCLKPRDMIEDGLIKCSDSNSYSCPNPLHCLRPSLNNATHLVIVEREDNNAVLYIGTPYDLYKTIIVDQYFPRFPFFSMFSPQLFERLLRYTLIFSMGVGFLNIIPSYGTDGHHIARNVIQLIGKYFNKNDDFVTLTTTITVIVGTGITWPLLMYLFYKAVYYE